jgi:hypothetical protein
LILDKTGFAMRVEEEQIEIPDELRFTGLREVV